jgi:hypothetical protein
MAEGKDEEEAVAKLKEHLTGLIPVYENTIAWTQDIIKGINEFINSDKEKLNG